jgi:hypothetical protein
MSSRLTWLAAGAVVAFYAWLGLVVLVPEAVYSGDIGVKYVQAQALAENRFASLNIPYPGDFIDPAREFSPLRPPFVIKTAGETQAIFPPASAVIQAVAVRAAGFRGMIAVSIVSAAVVLIAAWRMAPAGYGLAIVLAIGLGGPLWFYAVSGWEHAPAVAFGTAAFAVALRSLQSPFIAGVLVGSGAALRDEVMLLAPGLLLAVWIRERGWRRLVAAAAGVAVPLLLAGAIEVWWFNRPPAAHLRHAVHLLQSALQVTSEPNPDVPVLRPMTPRERYDTVVTYWMFGRGTDRQVAMFVGGLLAALVVRWKWRSSAGLLVWLLAFGVTTAGDVWEVLTAPKWLAGLVRVAPYAVFAILPAALGSDPGRRITHPLGSDPGRAFRGIVAFTTVAYLLIAYVGVDTSGGKSLGPRLLLPILPLLCASAVVVISSYLRSSNVIDCTVGWTGVAMVLMAALIHLGGTVPAYVQRNAEDGSAVVAAAASPVRIVVADDMYTAQLLFPLYNRKIILLADTVEAGARLGALLAQQRLDALLVSRHVEPSIALTPLRLERTDLKGRMVVQVYR